MNKIILILIPLLVSMLACGTAPAVIANTPQPKAAPTESRQTAEVCAGVESVRVRSCPGTSCGEVGTLSAGEVVTVYGVPTVSEDMGLWINVNAKGLIGWMNERYLCEAK